MSLRVLRKSKILALSSVLSIVFNLFYPVLINSFSFNTPSSSSLAQVPNICGNGAKEDPEECDGVDLGGLSSSDFTCKNNCTLDLVEPTVSICHSTASSSNPYNQQDPNKSADVSGHDGHNGPIWYSGISGEWGDIIPPFVYVGGSYLGKNWTTDGEAIWNNNCEVAYCGDGTVNQDVEQCDDGNVVSGDGCEFDCTLPLVEICDNGVDDDVDTQVDCADSDCANDPVCLTPVCTESSWTCEECVDGPTTDPVCYGQKWTYCTQTYGCNFDQSPASNHLWSCPNACPVTNVCGDNNVGDQEQCDDGNVNSNDGCSATCTLEGHILIKKVTNPDTDTTTNFSFHGNAGGSIRNGGEINWGWVAPGSYSIGEDDPTSSGYALESIVCNDEQSQTPSVVDLGTREVRLNLDPAESLECVFTNIKTSTCGDGVLGVNEQCDYGNLNGQSSCSSECTWVNECREDMVANGNFETPTVTDSSGWDFFDNSQVSGWTAEWEGGSSSYNGQDRPTDAKIELHRGVLGSASEGEQYVELDTDWDGPGGGLNGEPASISLYQQIPTISGNKYTLTWNYSPRPNHNNNQLEVKVGDTVVFDSGDIAGGGSVDWKTETYTFVADSDLTTVRFTEKGNADSLGMFLDDVSVGCLGPVQRVSEVTVCKYDGNQSPVSGWNVSLKGDLVETVNVLPDGNDYNSGALETDDYVLEANGFYTYRPATAGAEYTDANYSKRHPSDPTYGGDFAPWVNVNTFQSPYTGWLGVMVNTAPSGTNWSNYFAPDHKYTLGYPAYDAGSFRFTILDDVYSDNSGSIPVSIYKGYGGTTEQNGCVTFSNVPQGSYVVDEVMQDGWVNTSGLGQVAVDEATETFDIYNRQLPTKGNLSICKYNDLNGDGQIGDGENKLWWNMTVVDTDGPDTNETWITATPADACLTLNGMDFGSYDVTEATVSGWTRTYPTGSDTQSVSLSPETPDITVNFLNQETPPVTINASKVVCDNEADLPNWGNGPSNNITAITAQRWVNAHPGCHLEEGWSFQWGDDSDFNPGDGTYGEVAGWNTFGPTDAGGNVTVEIPNIVGTTSQIKVREVLQNGFIPFTYTNSYNNDNNVSAEIYCSDDVLNYDNDDRITNPQYGETYYCVAWNVEFGSVTAHKFVDQNQNGVQDYEDGNKEGWNVYLYAGESCYGDQNPIMSGLTDINGNYVFGSLEPGIYSVLEETRQGWTNGSLNVCQTVQLNWGDDAVVNFGNFEWGSISGKKFEDLNGNGIYDAGELGLSGWSIYLDLNVNGVYNDGEPVQITDSEGNYSFGNLSKGDYHGGYSIREIQQNGWLQTYPESNGSHWTGISSGSQIVDKNFGNQKQNGFVTVYKFEDLNNNGVKDDGEVTLPNWDMIVGVNGGSSYTQKTDETGKTVFELASGEYVLSENAQEGWKQSGIYCDGGVGSGVKITAPGYAYGHHGNCEGWNKCGNAETCAQKACEANGYSKVTSYGDQKPCTEFTNCSLFHNIDVSLDYEADWGNWCPVMGVTDIVCDGSASVNGSLAITVNPGDQYSCYVGNAPLGSIHGYKWNDLNKNGFRDCIENGSDEIPEGTPEARLLVACELEPLLPEWDIFIDENENSSWDDGEPRTSTSSDPSPDHFGWYWFEDLLPGSYKVCEVQKTDWTQSYPQDPVCHTVTLPDNNPNRFAVSLNMVMGPEYNFGNYYVAPRLTLQKLNGVQNGTVDSAIGDTIDFEIILKVLDNNVYGAFVTDLLPDGFDFLEGSASAFSSMNGDLPVNPTYASPGFWDLGDLLKDEVVTLKYKAKVLSGVEAGLYKDNAFAGGNTAIPDSLFAQALDNSDGYGKVNDNFVGTAVNIVIPPKDQEADVEIDVTETEIEEEGSVLGASTEGLPATGVNFGIILFLLALLSAGLVSLKMATKKKSSKVLSLVLGLVLVGLTVKGAYAVSNLSVRLEAPKSPTSDSSFKVTFVALDLQGRPMTAECYKKSPSDLDFVKFGSDIILLAGGNTANCVVDGSIVNETGSYGFKVKVLAESEEAYSDPVSTVVYDSGAPGKPQYITKEDDSYCKYKLKYKTANDGGDTVRIEVYRSDEKEFTVGSGNFAFGEALSSNTQSSFIDSRPDCGKDYYYAIRAFDASDNPSSPRVEEVEETVTVTTKEEETTEGEVTGAVPVSGVTLGAGEEGSTTGTIEGEEATDEANEGGEGAVLGEEATDSSDEASEEGTPKRNVLALLPIVLFVLGLGGYYLYKKKGTSTQA